MNAHAPTFAEFTAPDVVGAAGGLCAFVTFYAYLYFYPLAGAP